ncbi:hypothetical protein EW145_g3506 [Phellinidium pouzarii]|uniref:Uncharacterized protein n=1 Tax=Phellinidium pouzarii TaxID=167371 RepID=A0A4S4L6U5_9AGAM|nr:hypothetical protein EW145_g3506 [Phellinidium pouzarii]
MNSSCGLKRSSVFEEGAATKRPRGGERDKPMSVGASKPGDDLFSGSDFHAKPASAGRKTLQVRAFDADGLFSVFQKPTTTTPARHKPIGALLPRPPPPVLSDTRAQDNHRRAMTPIKSRLQPLLHTGNASRAGCTPLTSRIHQFGLSVAKSTTPARKVFPFHVLPVPVPEIPAAPSAVGLKPLPSLKFDLGRRSKGKLKAMTTLQHPVIEIQKEKEVRGEALELQRGLLISPEKNGGKGRRFLRNGLAERAQRLVDRSSTAFTLWKKDLESQASSSRLGRLRPDLRVRITHIIQTTRISNVHARAACTLRSVLATCQMLDTSAIPIDSPPRTILFSFSPESHDSYLMDSNVEMSDSMDVLIWRPWSEIYPPEDQNGVVNLFSAPLGSGRDHIPLRMNNASTLLCSRFLVLPLASVL